MDLDQTKAVKPPTTHERQIQLLKDYGFGIDESADSMCDCLRYANYYRFKGYYLHWLKNDKVSKDTPIQKLLKVIDFDTQLKHLLLKLLLEVEIAFKAHIAYEIGHSLGSFGYLDQGNFIDAGRHKRFVEEVNKNTENSYELFVRHYRKKYSGNYPIWVVIEILPFGTTSMLYKNMKETNKKSIAKEYYNLDFEFIESWLEGLSHIRNICAHNSRLYNKGLPKNFMIANDDSAYMKRATPWFNLYPNTVFAALLSMKYLIKQSSWCEFLLDLSCLLIRYKDVIELKRLGMPYGWIDSLKSPTDYGINSCLSRIK